MIASVAGQVAAVQLSYAVIEVGGIGLQLHCTPSTLATLRVGERAALPTSMIVREDSLTLYGFLNEDEKQMFEMLQTASGVGPKVAQSALAVMSPEAVRDAVLSEDAKRLTAIPGVGLKGAQKIILELKDRLAKSGAVLTTSSLATPTVAWEGQVLSGLTSLGWSQREAETAVSAVADQAGPTPDIAALLRSALQLLRKKI